MRHLGYFLVKYLAGLTPLDYISFVLEARGKLILLSL
jgi:hypothetical protein